MNEDYFYKKGDDYELFVQVTHFTHVHEVITVIFHNNTWREDKDLYSLNDYPNLLFPKTYEKINENRFAAAQNQILSQINTTRTGLKEHYKKLWYNFLVIKLQIESELVEAKIDHSDFSLVTQFRLQREHDYEINSKRQAIHQTFNNNRPDILSHEDIFNKAASEMNENYLRQRAIIQSKIKKS